MTAITRPVHFTPVEIFRSLFNGSMLCRKAGIKSSSAKSDSQLPGYLTAFAGLLILSALRRMLAVACLAICVLPISDAMAAEVFTKDQGLQGSVVGVGYRFIKREKLTLSGRTGPGYVYQRYFGGDVEDYYTMLFGANLEAELPYGSKLQFGAEYLPAISDWQGNYLIRAAGDWMMPIIGWLDFKIALFETYNNKPPPDIDRNSFTTTAGLSFRF